MTSSPVPKAEPGLLMLIDELLGEQQSLTAVERFSHAHSQEAGSLQQKWYRDLIPLSRPAAGEQYAFEVDLDKCSGCKACVTACHALNGLDEEESWRDVGLLHSEDWRAPFQLHVSTSCHHCVEPGCLTGCPVLAYDKDPVTGIVRHLDDQCIGCQYCVMKCPYDVPKYSAKRGIVRKCDMCSNRLSHGEAPACVQACPSQAIRITLVNQNEVLNRFHETAESHPDENLFLPASPSPLQTFPTTRFKSARPLPAGVLAGDHGRISPADSHLPLVFMLVLSQLAVGLGAIAAFNSSAEWEMSISFIAGLIAVGCGVLHLGQPLKAWRCFLGWRNSWFSREVIAFGFFVPLTAINTILHWLAPQTIFHQAITWLAAFTGIAAVACSAMIYVDTRREFWRASQSFGKFFGSTLLLGCSGQLALAIAFPSYRRLPVTLLAVLICVVTIMKLAFEHRIFRHWVDEETPAQTPLNKTARLLEGELGRIVRWRIVCAIVGGVGLPVLLALNGTQTRGEFWSGMAMFSLCLLAELLERYLFFTAVAPEKMPGGVTI